MELLLCSALWSIAGIFMKLIPWSGFAIAGVRSVLAGTVMGLFMLLRHTPFVLCRRSVLGGIALCATLTLFSVANKLTTAANAIVLQFTAPIWIMLLSALLFHASFRRADVIAVALTFGGIALFFADGLGTGNTAGNLIALGAGLTFGCYYVSLGDSGEDIRMSSVLIGHALTFVAGLPFLLLTPTPLTLQTACSLGILGVFQLGVPYVLLAHASGWCSPLVCSLLGAVEPLLNPVWVAIFDGEVPGLLALAGALVVIVTITLWCIYNGKNEEKPT